jgi:hypothetical protein
MRIQYGSGSETLVPIIERVFAIAGLLAVTGLLAVAGVPVIAVVPFIAGVLTYFDKN